MEGLKMKKFLITAAAMLAITAAPAFAQEAGDPDATEVQTAPAAEPPKEKISWEDAMRKCVTGVTVEWEGKEFSLEEGKHFRFAADPETPGRMSVQFLNDFIRDAAMEKCNSN